MALYVRNGQLRSEYSWLGFSWKAVFKTSYRMSVSPIACVTPNLHKPIATLFAQDSNRIMHCISTAERASPFFLALNKISQIIQPLKSQIILLLCSHQQRSSYQYSHFHLSLASCFFFLTYCFLPCYHALFVIF